MPPLRTIWSAHCQVIGWPAASITASAPRPPSVSSRTRRNRIVDLGDVERGVRAQPLGRLHLRTVALADGDHAHFALRKNANEFSPIGPQPITTTVSPAWIPVS